MSALIQDIIIPAESSQCAEWMSYFDKLKSRFGEHNARTIWIKTWQSAGSTSCTTAPSFMKFLKQHQIDVSNAATRAVADISQIGSNIMDLGKGLTGVLAIGVPATLAIVLAMILYFLFRSSPSDLAALTPQGRIASLIK